MHFLYGIVYVKQLKCRDSNACLSVRSFYKGARLPYTAWLNFTIYSAAQHWLQVSYDLGFFLPSFDIDTYIDETITKHHGLGKVISIQRVEFSLKNKEF